MRLFLPDDALVTIGLDDNASLGILSSSAHDAWTFHVGGALGNAPRYTKADCFDPFPFPDATPEQRSAIAELAEELDATRKAALAEVPGLTMTEIYNLRDWLRQQSPSPSGEGSAAALSPRQSQKPRWVGAVSTEPFSKSRKVDKPHPNPSPKGEGLMADRARDARAGIVHRLHEQIDAAVAEAYGWPADLTPSEIVTRLVALNAERAKEEAEGNIRWLRPEYQIPRFANGTKPRTGKSKDQ